MNISKYILHILLQQISFCSQPHSIQLCQLTKLRTHDSQSILLLLLQLLILNFVSVTSAQFEMQHEVLQHFEPY